MSEFRVTIEEVDVTEKRFFGDSVRLRTVYTQTVDSLDVSKVIAAVNNKLGETDGN